MPERDALRERGSSLEDGYFRKKDRELIERMRRAAAAEGARSDLSNSSGLDDPELLQELHDLGFTPDTVGLLPIVPILQMAWVEGGITTAERDLIIRFARRRGIEDGSVADERLTQWMTNRPADSVFARAGRLLRAVLDSGSDQAEDLMAEDLVEYCESIAAASGGFLGLGRISGEEQTLLAQIAADLKGRHSGG